MIRTALIVLLLATPTCFSSTSIPVEETINWQLTFTYAPGALSLVRAEPIASTSKKVRQPGMDGAVAKLEYTVEWLSSDGRVLLEVPVTIPLGLRVVLEDTADGEHDILIPSEGAFVLRMAGPAVDTDVSEIRLIKQSAEQPALSQPDIESELPAAFGLPEQTFALPDLAQDPAYQELVAGPVSSLKVHDTGPDNNRLVIVVMGDGFTAAELSSGSFSNHIQSFKSYFFGLSPWDDYDDAVNVYRVDIESNESGSDYEDAAPASGGTLKDTYLNSAFWVGGTERCCYLTGNGTSRAFAAADLMVGAGVWDEILVFVNSTKYGGCGGSVGVSSLHSSADEIQVHEFGHSFANLADEYEGSGSGCSPPGQPNIDCGLNFPSVKWDAWVTPGAPIPTPETSAYNTTVGAFEGAKYNSTGIYRPMLNCKMRALNVEFCPICKEDHILDALNFIDLADSTTPPIGPLSVPFGGSVTVAVQTVQLDGLFFDWKIGGVPVAGETGNTIVVSSGQIASPNEELRVTITHTTALVRAQTIDEDHSWTMNVIVLDSDMDGLPDDWEDANGLDKNDNGSIDPDNGPDGDPDQDGATNLEEYQSGTDPQSSSSVFKVTDFINSPGASNFAITVNTQPAYTYTLLYRDSPLSSSINWNQFGNTTIGIGSWYETGTVSSTYTFHDMFDGDTSGGQPADGYRFYRVRLGAPEAASLSLAELGSAPVLDGDIQPAEYGLGAPLYSPDGDDGFGPFNAVGTFYAGHHSESLYIGLRHATLEDSLPNNAMVIYINSPRINGGSSDPASGIDQGEPGDTGNPDYAESLITRASVNSAWTLPGSDFADLGLGLIDLHVGDSQSGIPTVRDNIGLYRFASPNSGDNLGFIPSDIVWADHGSSGGGSGEGGVELRIGFSDLGGLQLGDIIELVVFISNKEGYTSNETLPADLVNGANPGVDPVTFNGPAIRLKLLGP